MKLMIFIGTECLFPDGQNQRVVPFFMSLCGTRRKWVLLIPFIIPRLKLRFLASQKLRWFQGRLVTRPGYRQSVPRRTPLIFPFVLRRANGLVLWRFTFILVTRVRGRLLIQLLTVILPLKILTV